MPINPSMILAGAKIGSSILGGVLGSKSSRKAAELSEKIGQMNYAEFMRQAEVEKELGGLETLNLMESQARHRGTVEGMYAKSGMMLTGTPAAALQELGEDQAFNVEQAQESINERVRRIQHQARISLMTGQAQAAGLKEQAKGDIFQSMFGVLEGGMEMWSGWGGGPAGAKPGDVTSRTDPMYNLNLLSGWK